MSTLLVTSLTRMNDEQLETVDRQYDTKYLKIIPFICKHGISSQAMLIEVDVVEVTLRAGATDGAEREKMSKLFKDKHLTYNHSS